MKGIDRSALEAAYVTASMSDQIPTTEKGTMCRLMFRERDGGRSRKQPPDGVLKPNTGVAFLSQEKSGGGRTGIRRQRWHRTSGEGGRRERRFSPGCFSRKTVASPILSGLKKAVNMGISLFTLVLGNMCHHGPGCFARRRLSSISDGGNHHGSEALDVCRVCFGFYVSLMIGCRSPSESVITWEVAPHGVGVLVSSDFSLPTIHK